MNHIELKDNVAMYSQYYYSGHMVLPAGKSSLWVEYLIPV